MIEVVGDIDTLQSEPCNVARRALVSRLLSKVTGDAVQRKLFADCGLVNACKSVYSDPHLPTLKHVSSLIVALSDCDEEACRFGSALTLVRSRSGDGCEVFSKLKAEHRELSPRLFYIFRRLCEDQIALAIKEMSAPNMLRAQQIVQAISIDSFAICEMLPSLSVPVADMGALINKCLQDNRDACSKVDLDTTCKEYLAISRYFYRCLTSHRLNYHSSDWCLPPLLEICSIKHILPSDVVADQYSLGLKKMKKMRPQGCAEVSSEIALRRPSVDGIRMNEMLLWHGCNADGIEQIISNGFDPRLAGMATAAMFGQGVYFAEHSSKCDFYSKPDPHDVRRMLLVLVCLGNAFRTTASGKSWTMPPCSQCFKERRKECQCNPKGTDFDAVSAVTKEDGGKVDFPEHVIYSNSQALPIAEISYKHISQCRCKECRR
mmetsp:Transcript_168250/g.540539  ORF Transcript_168250/g.540539 Transcript_168250/m.540539 type:complete len:433 (+) Transcript_168250:1698-2996(+)